MIVKLATSSVITSNRGLYDVGGATDYVSFLSCISLFSGD
jgi:hypothetical protein